MTSLLQINTNRVLIDSVDISNQDRSWYNRSHDEALLSNKLIRCGAIYVCGAVILSSHNKNKMHRILHGLGYPEYTNSVHAELAILKKLNDNYPSSRRGTIFVARIGKADNCLNSMPCKACIEIIKNTSFIDTLVYMNNGELKKSSIR